MDLQLGLLGPGPGREDFQDEFGPVDDAEFGHVFQVADLDWGQFIVDDEDGGPESLGQVFDFSYLTLAQVAGGNDVFRFLLAGADNGEIIGFC